MTTGAKPLENELTFSRFDSMSEKYADRPALIYLGSHISYRQLRELSERFAGALQDLGVAKGQRVMIYIPNCVQWVIAFLGIEKVGGVVVPVAPIYTSHEISYMIKDAEVETVICQDTNFCYVKEALANTGLKRVIVTNLVELLPAGKRILGHLFDKIPTGTVDNDPRVHRFTRLLRHAPLVEPVAIDPVEDLAYILYTGGTTGFPKGVPGNHQGMTSYVGDITEDVAGEHLREGGDSYIAINPLFHIMALGLFMAIGLNKGNTTIIMPAPQMDSILETIQRYKVRWLLGVPALYRMILENDRLDRYDLGSITYCYCGGDVLPEEVKERWRKRTGVPIYQVYGSTEVGHVTYSRIGVEPSPRAIGFPLKSRECMIVDPATLEPVERGKNGELLVTSPYTLKRYYNKPKETERTYVEIGGKTWCRMGDFVSELPTGELIYQERSADIIKHKAFRVSASEVEAVLQDHPTVIGACVVGVPDPKVGERIKAIVVLKEDARGVGGTELMQWCRERLAAYKVPSYIEFRDMLPKSKVGKLLRREVRDDEIRRIAKAKSTTNSKEIDMDLFSAIEMRTSCRAFLADPIDKETILKVLAAGTRAPSPLNSQPWQFIVITGQAKKQAIHEEAERCRKWAIEQTGWKWLASYKTDFLLQAPVLVMVVGDPQKSGMDVFQEEGTVGYLLSCAAAVQNILLAAQALELGSLFYTMYDKKEMRRILGIEGDKTPVALVCLGKPARPHKPVPRKDVEEKTIFLEE